MENKVISKNSTRANPSLGLKLRAFKEAYCDENLLIADVVCRNFRDHLRPVILDVGAGLGDLASACFPDKPAILLDTEHWDGRISPQHQRVAGDFFDYVDGSPPEIGTLLMAHVLQYLDDDLARLRGAVEKLRPKVILTVLNDNTGEFGEIIRWSLRNIPDANPELPLQPADPDKYGIVGAESISATMQCASFNEMAQFFVTVLLDADGTESTVRAVREQLESRLKRPAITIDQTVSCYERR